MFDNYGQKTFLSFEDGIPRYACCTAGNWLQLGVKLQYIKCVQNFKRGHLSSLFKFNIECRNFRKKNHIFTLFWVQNNGFEKTDISTFFDFLSMVHRTAVRMMNAAGNCFKMLCALIFLLKFFLSRWVHKIGTHFWLLKFLISNLPIRNYSYLKLLFLFSLSICTISTSIKSSSFWSFWNSSLISDSELSSIFIK